MFDCVLQVASIPSVHRSFPIQDEQKWPKRRILESWSDVQAHNIHAIDLFALMNGWFLC